MGFCASTSDVEHVVGGRARRLEAGDRVGPARLVVRLRVSWNGELWSAVLPDGLRAVVKRVDHRAVGHGLFTRERAALQRLVGGPAPDLVWSEEWPTGGALVLSGSDGQPLDRAVTAADRRTGMLGRAEVGLAVLEAYTELHDRGVLHGSVHPRNVLVDRRGRATIVAFGLAEVAGSGLPSAVRRSGIEQLDPVAAEALWADQPAPCLDAGAEQYAIGTVLFRALTGRAYLDLERARADVLAAVMSESPRSFAELGAGPWPAGERIVRRSLAKAPWLRFASVAQLRASFECEVERLPSQGGALGSRVENRIA